MKKELEFILSLADISSEERKKFDILLCNDDELEKAKEINNILYLENSDQYKKLIYSQEDEQSGLVFSMAYLFRMVYIKDFLVEKGINDKYFKDLINVWRDVSRRSYKKYGFYGLNGVYRSFLYDYMKPARFTLGRLNFEINCLDEDYEVYRDGKCVLKHGDPVLYVHIPANGRLDPELVDESFLLAKEFFAKYFPEHNYKAFVCSSWLLDKNLKRILKPDSNIIAFQNRFVVVTARENSFSLYWHIFGIEDFLPPEKLVPANDFQMRILDYIKSGNKLLSGKGYILI